LTDSERSDDAGLVVTPTRAASRAYRGEIIFAVMLAVYGVLALLAHRYDYFGWDLSLARRIQSITITGFNTVMTWISALGNGWVPTALVIAAGCGLAARRLRIEALICVAGVAAGSGLNRVLKALIDRPRPVEPLVNVAYDVSHESFPSGHVVFFVEFFGFLFFLTYALLRPGWIRRSALVLIGGLIAVIGVSRVYLGAHWPSDVFGAYLAGGLWLMLMIELYRRIKSKQES
jgi:undecaprenyl-diphosphatase